MSSFNLTSSTRLTRQRVDELMDSPELPLDQHRRALAGLRRINRVSGIANQLAREVTRWAKRTDRSQIRLLDVACGGGDVPVRLARKLIRRGLSVELVLMDRSENAADEALKLARRHEIKASSHVADATHILPEARFDVVTNSLFLHHLDRAESIRALENMRRCARLLLVSDLSRSVIGLGAARLGCKLLSRSPVVHFDGPASVRAAWSVDEMRQLAQCAGLIGAEVRCAWPFRWLLKWEQYA